MSGRRTFGKHSLTSHPFLELSDAFYRRPSIGSFSGRLTKLCASRRPKKKATNLRIMSQRFRKNFNQRPRNDSLKQQAKKKQCPHWPTDEYLAIPSVGARALHNRKLVARPSVLGSTLCTVQMRRTCARASVSSSTQRDLGRAHARFMPQIEKRKQPENDQNNYQIKRHYYDWQQFVGLANTG